MDWLMLEDKINKVMGKVAQLNGDVYHESFYNPHPYPGWCPELKHIMWGFIKELKEKEAAGVATKVDLETLSELFDVIIRSSDMLLKNNEFKQKTKVFVKAVNAFNYKLLNALSEANGNEVKNVFVSPGRLQAMLVLLSNWVDWYYKRDRILDAICCKDMNPMEVNEMFADERYLIPYVNKEKMDEGYIPTIELKTMMWYKKGLNLSKRYLIDTEKPFHVLFKALDFDSPSASDNIKHLVKNASHGLINDLQIELTNETRALLVDVLYFKATWQSLFDEDCTRTRNFYYKGGSSKVKMMSVTDVFRYYENDTFQSISLDYHSHAKTRNYSMWIHLPKQGHKIKEVLAQITEEKIGTKYKQAEVHLNLPRFELESKTSLTEVLKVLGMEGIFASDDVIPNLLKDVKIDDIVQQGRIEVNEAGTEAAMATYCVMFTGCPPHEKPKPIEMKVNHEFIFEVVEAYTGIRLFSGFVNKL